MPFYLQAIRTMKYRPYVRRARRPFDEHGSTQVKTLAIWVLTCYTPKLAAPAQAGWRLSRGLSDLSAPRKDPMPKRDAIEVEGTVIEALPDAKFRVALDGGDRVVLAYLSGKVKLNFVRIVPGDRVRLELSPYDLSQGRITWRNRT